MTFPRFFLVYIKPSTLELCPYVFEQLVVAIGLKFNFPSKQYDHFCIGHRISFKYTSTQEKSSRLSQALFVSTLWLRLDTYYDWSAADWLRRWINFIYGTAG